MTLLPYTRERASSLDRWFDRTLFGADHWPTSLAVAPTIDAHSDEEGLVVKLEVPGVAPDRISLEVQDQTLKLSIAGEDESETSRSYARAFRIPADLDTTKVEAKLEYGVLTVRIPKAEAAKPRPIQISLQ